MKLRLFNLFFACLLFTSVSKAQDHSVAREWNEFLLESIRNDFARPTVHARNLFHTSIAMYDAWAVYDETAEPFFLGKQLGDYFCVFEGVPMPDDIRAAQEEAMSYAALRLLQYRFRNSPNTGEVLYNAEIHFAELGYDPNYYDENYTNGNPADLGNYIANRLFDFGLQDKSNEQFFYENQYYQPVNEPLVTDRPGNPNLVDPNRWQPLTLEIFIDQSGNERPGNTPPFLSPEWGQVTPFALEEEDLSIYNRDGFDYYVYHDPGMPPQLQLDGGGMSEEYKWGFMMVPVWSSHLDPNDDTMIDISPATLGNSKSLPTSLEEYHDFYKFFEGGAGSQGHELNPVTGQAYEPQMVKRGDYARILAEFWADGPDSETPPGHWFTLLNYVNDHPEFEKRYEGKGEILDDLEWDVKSYFLMGGAMHDCAITAWGIKGYYDYLRPISAIRYMADLGQSTDITLPNYHPAGIPLIEGYSEVVNEGDPWAGANNENVGKIKLYTWRGPDYISNPQNTFAGVGWILAENWFPYQRPSFVTPNFAGYVSGHSTYSRAAAELLTMLTGDEFFPGGMGEFEAPKNEFLVFEDGPSEDITLQWATYRDASDQTSLSRIWGGIHPPADDIPGRHIGIAIAEDAFAYGNQFFFSDEDNDGYLSNVDCDDTDATINPEAEEIANNDIDENCDGELLVIDNDMDGFNSDEDCNDADATINPSAEEIANNDIDEDCDGVALMIDNDMDGFNSDEDCDDTDATINPSAEEIANNDIDENCDGNILIIDNDMDGFNSDEDCDDTDATINPSAEEIANNDIDENCDGTALIIDNDMDGFNSDEDCDDEDATINPAAEEIANNGIDEDCNGEDFVSALTYIDGQQLNIYPNPVNTNLWIEMERMEAYEIQIYSITGQRLLQQQLSSLNNRIDVSELNTGVYLLEISATDNESKVVEKIQVFR